MTVAALGNQGLTDNRCFLCEADILERLIGFPYVGSVLEGVGNTQGVNNIEIS